MNKEIGPRPEILEPQGERPHIKPNQATDELSQRIRAAKFSKAQVRMPSDLSS